MREHVETFKKALHNEVRAQAFYRMAADATRRDECAMVFMGLAEVEDDHARRLVERLGSSPRYRDFDAPAYLARLEETVDTSVPPPDEKVVREGDVTAILKLAKRFEIESRDTYRDLARDADDPDTRAMCEELCRLEEDHLREIVKLERSMAMPTEERPAL